MKKIILIIAMLTLLTGCNAVKTDYSQLNSLRISHGTSRMVGSYEMNITKENNIYYYTYKPSPDKYGEMKCALEETSVKQILEVLKKYNASKWNGFDKANKHVLDGDSFGFDADLNDAKISAGGYESYPKNYNEAVNEIEEILSSYTDAVYLKAREEYINQDFDGEIESFLAAFMTPGYPKDHEVHFHFYKTDAGDYYGYYSIKLSEDDVIEAGDYNWDGNIEFDKLDVNKLKKSFDENGIKYRDGIEDAGDNPEWYQISVEFSDEKRIETFGSTEFDGYITFRTSVFELIENLIETNKTE